MSLKIERVGREDLNDLVKISRETFYDTFSGQNKKEDMDLFLKSSLNPEKLREEMSEPDNHFFFAKEADLIVGYLKLSTAVSDEIDGEVLEIARIYVVKEKLGSGVGKALLEFAISFAKQLNKKTVYLGVWEHNKKAINFYDRFCFTKFGEHVFMVGRDPQTDWLLKKEL
ncbi:GNAT family N-acetyltransferase [Segetibacter sp.]|jgi:ribosomal protein S18 acetylase RimI-like enzyme|uniref:GNAT family N-acetyltransferase n=1 Tax=Segetibacter sp. TaxID=2231182 RepID=UPI002636B7F8|nr:GNAT family N-acetyltransferase [Segetibacter sp.]MCW3079095.1 family N-acetyltransferase [Segetibacter sp.]